MWNCILTPESCRKTLFSLLDLEMWYARQLAKLENIPLSEALCDRVEFYHHSSCFREGVSASRNPEWQKLSAKLIAAPEHWQQECGQYYLDGLEARIHQQQELIRQSFSGFMYEFHSRYFSDSLELYLTLHFRNFFAPHNPFLYPDQLQAGLRTLLDRALAQQPEIRYVQCASWLNQRPEFLRLFPPSYAANPKDCYPETNNTGWWGQFINAGGGFNEKAAAEFIANGGRFTYHNTHCICTVQELLSHLAG